MGLQEKFVHRRRWQSRVHIHPPPQKKKNRWKIWKDWSYFSRLPWTFSGEKWSFFLKFFQTGSVLRLQGTCADYSCRQTFMEMSHVSNKRRVYHTVRQVRDETRLFFFKCYTFTSEMRQTHWWATVTVFVDCLVSLYIFTCSALRRWRGGEWGGSEWVTSVPL